MNSYDINNNMQRNTTIEEFDGWVEKCSDLEGYWAPRARCRVIFAAVDHYNISLIRHCARLWGADSLKCVDECGRTALCHLACEGNYYKESLSVAKVLIAYGIDINAKTTENYCEPGYFDKTLHYGYTFYLIKGATALTAAANRGNRPLIRVLLKGGALGSEEFLDVEQMKSEVEKELYFFTACYPRPQNPLQLDPNIIKIIIYYLRKF